MTTNKMKPFYLAIFACILLAFAMPSALADMTGVSLISPEDGFETASHRIDLEFSAASDFDSLISCDLYIDGSKEGSMTASSGSDETFDNIYLKSGSHSWYVNCTDSNNSRSSDEWELEIESYCEDGETGDLEIIRIYSPDEGDDFAPGSRITVEVKVENNDDDDLEVVVAAELYDITDEDSISDDEATVDIDEDDSETVEFTITIPADIDADNDFIVRVKAYEDGNEDDNCMEDSVAIEIERERHDLAIDEVEIDPSTAQCGGTAYVMFSIYNVGENDEDIKLEVTSPFFSWTKTFDLDSEDDDSFNVPMKVPENVTDGEYTVTIKAYYDKSGSSYDESESATGTLKVSGGCAASGQGAALEPSQLSDAFAGSEFSVKVKITNTGAGKTTYTIGASEYGGWASLKGIDPQTLTLDAGESGYAYITLDVNEDASGINTFKALADFGGTSEEQEIMVSLGGQTEQASALEQFMFNLKRNWGWAILIVLLVAAIVVLSVLLGNQGRRNSRRERDDRFSPAEIQIRKVNGKKSRIVRNF